MVYISMQQWHDTQGAWIACHFRAMYLQVNAGELFSPYQSEQIRMPASVVLESSPNLCLQLMLLFGPKSHIMINVSTLGTFVL